MRWVFLALVALSNMSQIPIALSVADGSVLPGVFAASAEMWLVISAVWLLRAGRPRPVVDLIDCGALLVAGLGGGSSSIVVSTMFPTVFFTCTYGSTRRVALRTAGFLVAFLLAVAPTHDLDVRFLPGYVISMLTVAAVMHLLTGSLKRYARALVYQQTLAVAGTRLVAARTREDIYDAALVSAHELLANESWIAAAFVLASEQTMVVVAARGAQADVLLGQHFGGKGLDPSRASVRLPSELGPFRDVLLAPLTITGEVVGGIVLASPSAIPHETEVAIVALAAETVLALETLSSSERFRSLVQHSTDVFTILGADGRISYQSPSFARLTGMLPETTIGVPMTALLHPQDAAELSGQLADHFTTAVQLQLRWRHVDGHWRQTEAIVNDRLDDPSVKGWMFNVRDVSERARLEMVLRQAQKLESIGRLAAGMAHEINTPIQFIGDNLRFLQDSMGDLLRRVDSPTGELDGDDVAQLEHEIPSAIEESLEGVNRVAAIVRSMQEFAHPGGRQQETADLNQALMSTLAVARNELRSVGRVLTDLGELPPVMCFQGELNQVFLNLIVNAAHALADAGRGNQGIIQVRSRRAGDEVVISIEDNGGGIPESIRAQLFDPFFTTKQVGRGTGQGLAVARSIIVDRHGGAIDFSSAIGQGTTFTVRLAIGGVPTMSERVAA